MNKHNFAPTILRAYDIRGIYQDTLTEADAHAIGMAFIATLRQRGHGVMVAVGRDGRLSSPALAAALIDGAGAGWWRGAGYRLRADADAVFCRCHMAMRRGHSGYRLA